MKNFPYSLVICENEKVQQELLLKLTKQYAESKQICLETACFDSAEAFLFNYEENKKVDIILLDIQMEDLDGITMAKQLRAQHDSVQIIFISGYSEHIGEGYQVEAIDYLIKPFTKEQLAKAFDRAFKQLEQEEEYLLLETEDSIQKIAIQAIETIESSGRNTEWELSDGRVLTAKLGIAEAVNMLEEYPSFFQSHRTAVVNFLFVEELKKDEFVMESGKPVPISRRTLKEAKERFLSFHLKGDDVLK